MGRKLLYNSESPGGPSFLARAISEDVQDTGTKSTRSELLCTSSMGMQIRNIREIEIDGAYALILEFASPQYPFVCWQQHYHRLQQIAGTELHLKITQPQIGRVDFALVALPTNH